MRLFLALFGIFALVLAAPSERAKAGEIGLGLGGGVAAVFGHSKVYVGGGAGVHGHVQKKRHYKKRHYKKRHRHGHTHYHKHPHHGHKAHKPRHRAVIPGERRRVRGFGYYKGHHFIYGGYAWRHISAHHAHRHNYCHLVTIRHHGKHGPAVSCHKPKYGRHVQYVAAVGY